MNSRDRDPHSSSLTVKLMAVAAEHELQVKREKQRLEAKLAELASSNEEYERRHRQQAYQIESLTRKLEEAVAEVQRFSVTQEERMEALLYELIAVKFELADSTQAVGALKRELRAANSSGDEEKDGRAHSPLSDRDADGDIHSKDMLFLAAEEGLEEIVRGILNPKLSRQGVLGEVFGHALRRAARNGHMSVVKRLLAADAHLSVRSTEEDMLFQTCLHAASAGGHEPVLRLLLSHAKERVQQAQHSARDGVSPDVSQWFALDPNDTDALGRTPLHLAAAGNHSAAAKCLLLHGADPDAADDAGQSVLACAEREGAAAVARVLVDPSVLFWNASVRANRLYNDKRFESAIAAYSAAIQYAADKSMSTTARDMATLHYNRARASFRIGKHCAAVDDCCTALDRDATYRNAIAQRAECYMSLFEFDKACRDFQALLDADSTDKQWGRRLSEARSLRDMTHYQVLGLLPDCDAAAIKKAYRTLCLRWHPDKHTASPEAQLRANTAFRRINEANDVLTDSYKRMVYDLEKRPLLHTRASEITSFDVWFTKEREREAERVRDIESVLAADAAASSVREQARLAAKQQLSVREKQAQAQAQRQRLVDEELRKRQVQARPAVAVDTTAVAPPSKVSTPAAAAPIAGVVSLSPTAESARSASAAAANTGSRVPEASPTAAPLPGVGLSAADGGPSRLPAAQPPPIPAATPPLPFVTGDSPMPAAGAMDPPPGYSSSTLPDLASLRSSLLSSWDAQQRESQEVHSRLLQRKEQLLQEMEAQRRAEAAAPPRPPFVSVDPQAYINPEATFRTDDTLPSVESDDDGEGLMSPMGGEGVPLPRRHMRPGRRSPSPTRDLSYSDVLDDDDDDGVLLSEEDEEDEDSGDGAAAYPRGQEQSRRDLRFVGRRAAPGASWCALCNSSGHASVDCPGLGPDRHRK